MDENGNSNGALGPLNYLFDRFVVNERNRELFSDVSVVPLTPKAFDILLVFLKNPDRLLEKDELIEMVWESRFVEEGNLARNVSTLRKALGGGAHDHRYIVTVPGRGYRFVAEVSTASENESTFNENGNSQPIRNGIGPLSFFSKPYPLIFLMPLIFVLALVIWLSNAYFSRGTNATSQREQPTNPEARQAYLTGKYLFQQASDKTGISSSRPLLIKSVENYQKAISIEPDFAPLYADYARACHRIAGTGYQKAYYYDQAREASKKALELDETLSNAHATLAFNTNDYLHDLKGAEKEYVRALELDANSEFRHSHAMNLAMLGQIDEAVTEIEIALRSDPNQPIVRQNAGRIYLEAGRVDKAVEQFKSVVDLAPQNPIGFAHLGIAQVIAGQYDDGIANIQRFLQTESDPEDRALLGWALAVAGRRSEARAIADALGQQNNGHVPAMIYSGLGENEKALAELERNCLNYSRDLSEIRITAYYFNLRNEPRFQALVRKLDEQAAL